MIKGLEALKCIKNVELQIGNDLNTITKVFENNTDYDTCFESLEKELKAFEIIKEKNVFVWGFIHRKEEIKDFEWTYDYYKTHYGYFHSGYKFELLTEEEFDLLKEVLL